MEHCRIVQRLPHALEDNLLNLMIHSKGGHLANDLIGCQVPAKLQEATGTMATRTSATNLRGHADGVVHKGRALASRSSGLCEDRLCERTILKLEEDLREITSSKPEFKHLREAT